MTIEKVKAIAKEKYGKDMTDDMAAKYMEKYADKLGKLADEELDNVSGGYTICDEEFRCGAYCEPCGVWCDNLVDTTINRTFKCPICGKVYE